MRKILIALLSLFITLSFAGAANASTVRSQQDLSTRTKDEIVKEYNSYNFVDWSEYRSPFASNPDYTDTSKIGKIKPELLVDGVNTINFARYLNGLQGKVSLDYSIENQMQTGAYLVRTLSFSHTPANSKSYPDSFYQLGLKATMSSNIGTGTNIHEAVKAYLSDADNATALDIGHRKSLLSTSLDTTMFGLTDGMNLISVKQNPTLINPYEYEELRSWPSAGYFPTEFFSERDLWSISTGSEYQWTSGYGSEIVVKVTRENDGKVWRLDSNSTNANGDYLDGAHMLFKPSTGKINDGDIYTIEVSGLKTKSGSKTSLKYTTKFFSIDSNSASSAPNNLTFLKGATSYDTSIEIAKQFVKEEGKLNNLVIATGGNWPDALSGNSLAGAVNSPMLMIPSNMLDASKQLDFIYSNVNSGGTIYILGGTGAVTQDYEDTLKVKGFMVKRLWGMDAIDTSIEVAKEVARLNGVNGVVIVGRSNYVDAVSIASYANKNRLPILITEQNETKDSVISFVKEHSSTIKNVYLIGGTGVVGNQVSVLMAPHLINGTMVYDKPNGTIVHNSVIQRLGGLDRFDTNNIIGTKLQQDASRFTVVDNEDFISALSGGAYAGKHNMFLMIVPKDALATGNLKTINNRKITKQDVTIFGSIAVQEELVSNLR